MKTLAIFNSTEFLTKYSEEITAVKDEVTILGLIIITTVATASVVLLIIAWVRKARTAK